MIFTLHGNFFYGCECMFERTNVPTNCPCPSDQMSTYTDFYDRIHRSLEAFRSLEYASLYKHDPSFRTQTPIGETSDVTLRFFRPCLHSSLSIVIVDIVSSTCSLLGDSVIRVSTRSSTRASISTLLCPKSLFLHHALSSI